MDSAELRKKFLDFFEKRGHTLVPSSSLLPTDPSVLFTAAGMQQFKDFYLGKESPFGKNVVSCQKCLRTSDIEEVGDERHLTFFEMLGNFSFGGYFKKEAIKLAYEFIAKETGLEIDYVTIFDPQKVAKGDWRATVQRDQESYDVWEKEVGIPEDKIKICGVDNFWGPTGEEGPCGPTTEIYVKNKKGQSIEVWNVVFNEFFRDKSNALEKLKRPGVDTGMGLERLAMISQKGESVFETDLFAPILKGLEKETGVEYSFSPRLFRIIVDHIKSSVFLAGEGFLPSNIDQGYILRRLLRRAIRFGRLLKSRNNFLIPLAKITIEIYRDSYPDLKLKETNILTVIQKEEEKFDKTIEKGLRELEKIVTKSVDLTGDMAFDLYQTYGFPLELSKEIFAEKTGKEIKNENLFWDNLKKHQDISRAGSEKKFKGGLADENLETIKLHTAAHLMLAGLRKVLGGHVSQKGSNITKERLRFDFSHKEKMTPEQIKAVEDFVNVAIQKDLTIKCEEVSLETAKKEGATGVFEQKYGEKVKVYTIGQGKEIFSKEICGGPHVEKTGDLGHFRITKEESSSAGIRRIKAVLE